MLQETYILVILFIGILYAFSCNQKCENMEVIKYNTESNIKTNKPLIVDSKVKFDEVHNNKLHTHFASDNFNKYAKLFSVYNKNIMNNEMNNTSNIKQTVTKCNIGGKNNAGTCGEQYLHPILDPKFNMREVAKQCLLLEDHLNNKKKRCIDCIKKHFLMIDGLLEESVSLEKDNATRDYYRKLYLEWVKIEKDYVNKTKEPYNMDEISKTIRAFRKPLCLTYFDIVSEYDE